MPTLKTLLLKENISQKESYSQKPYFHNRGTFKLKFTSSFFAVSIPCIHMPSFSKLLQASQQFDVHKNPWRPCLKCIFLLIILIMQHNTSLVIIYLITESVYLFFFFFYGLQAHGLQQLWHAGSAVVARGLQSTGSAVVAHRLHCSAARGIFPDQGSNLCPLHWQTDAQPLCHQGSPESVYLLTVFIQYIYWIYPIYN